jgi:hypothetical protein
MKKLVSVFLLMNVLLTGFAQNKRISIPINDPKVNIDLLALPVRNLVK